MILTSEDAAEALETIERLARDRGRDVIVARLMRDDPHEPPYWWHVRPMLNLTLLCRIVGAQAGIAPPPGKSFPVGRAVDPVIAEESLSLVKATLSRWKDGAEPIPPAILPTYESQTWIDIDKLEYDVGKWAPAPSMGSQAIADSHLDMAYRLSTLLEEIPPNRRGRSTVPVCIPATTSPISIYG